MCLVHSIFVKIGEETWSEGALIFYVIGDVIGWANQANSKQVIFKNVKLATILQYHFCLFQSNVLICV